MLPGAHARTHPRLRKTTDGQARLSWATARLTVEDYRLRNEQDSFSMRIIYLLINPDYPRTPYILEALVLTRLIFVSSYWGYVPATLVSVGCEFRGPFRVYAKYFLQPCESHRSPGYDGVWISFVHSPHITCVN